VANPEIVRREIFADTYSIGGFAAERNYILTFEHDATGHSVSFPSNIQSFNDSHSAVVSEKMFAGRMDPLIQQASTGRKISFSFEVLNSSIEEARYNEQSINLLLQMMYPRLRTDGGVQAGSFIKISGLTFLRDSASKKSTTCLINQISYNLNVDEGFITPTSGELHPISIVINVSAVAIIPSQRGESESPIPSSYPRYR
jgi:hypothetical protein